MKKAALVFFVFSFFLLKVTAQDSSYLANSLKGSKWATSDALGNLYLYRDGWLVRIEPERRKDSFKINEILNPLIQIDIKWTHKKLIFFPETYSILTIGSRMGEVSNISLQNLDFSEVDFVKYSPDGMIWILDNNSKFIYKINENLSIKNKHFLPKNITKNWSNMHVFKSQIALIDSISGVLWLNELGGQLAWQECKEIKQSWQIRDLLIIYKKNKLWILNYNQEPIELIEYIKNDSSNYLSLFEWNAKIWIRDGEKISSFVPQK